MYHCCTDGVTCKGLAFPNKKFYTKRKDGFYWSIGSKKSRLNNEIQQMRPKSDEAGTGRSPFLRFLPHLTGAKAGSSTFIYWDDSKDVPPPRKDVKRTKYGPTSKFVKKFCDDRTVYWFHEYDEHEMCLIGSCKRQTMECFGQSSKINMEESTWDEDTWEVNNTTSGFNNRGSTMTTQWCGYKDWDLTPTHAYQVWWCRM